MAANGAQYGVATVNYYWIGAIPAMVFLGLVMMPFYYGSKVRSVPSTCCCASTSESHIFNSVTFALATILIAGVNLYALALGAEVPARLADHRSASSSPRSSWPSTSASAASRRRSTTRCCSSS
jgi:hypothetical protein